MIITVLYGDTDGQPDRLIEVEFVVEISTHMRLNRGGEKSRLNCGYLAQLLFNTKVPVLTEKNLPIKLGVEQPARRLPQVQADGTRCAVWVGRATRVQCAARIILHNSVEYRMQIVLKHCLKTSKHEIPTRRGERLRM